MLLFLTVGLTIGVLRIADEYRDSIARGERIARSTARTAKAQAAQIIHEAGLVTSGIADVYVTRNLAKPVDKAYFEGLLREKLTVIPQVVAFVLFPPGGGAPTSVSTFDLRPGFNLAAEINRLDEDTSAARFFIGAPIKDVDNANHERWFVPVGTRIGAGEAPTGVVVALIDICTFLDFYESLKVGDHGRIALWTSAGQLVAKTSTVDLPIGTIDPAVKQAFAAASVALAKGDILVTEPGQDISPNAVAKAQIGSLPLMVTVHMDERDFLRDWRSTRNRLILTSLGFACATLAFTGIILSQLHRSRLNEEALRTAKAVAEEANEAKSRFLAHMSHEFRTPLNAIMGFSDVIQTKAMGDPIAPIYATYAGHIYRSGEHLLEIVNDILDMAKIESGIQSLDLQAIDIAAVINGSVSFLERMANAFHLSVKVAIAPNLHRVLGDERFVRQVLINLVSNAIKFSPAGRAVVVRATATQDGAIELSVIDHGHGIEPMILKRIGEPFLQGNPALSRAGQGTGLGLSICKHYMDLLGGELVIDSTLGVGTTVTMRFPRELRVADDETPAVPGPA
jgi:signal transduction histidine kinase